MTTITLKTKLPDSNDDKVVDVSAAGAKKYGVPKPGKWYGPLPGQPSYTYSDEDPATTVDPIEPVDPVVTPPPPPIVTPPIGVMARLSNLGESCLQTADLVVGLNVTATIGTEKGVPLHYNDDPVKGFRSDTRTGLVRVGMFAGAVLPKNAKKPKGQLDDVILQGRAVSLFGAIINGKLRANALLNGSHDIKGAFSDPFNWKGAVDGFEVTRGFGVEGRSLAINTRWTNRTSSPIELRPFVAVDFDQSSDDEGGTKNFATNSRVTAPGVVESKLYGGGLVVLRAEGATFFTQDSVGRAKTIGAERPVGATKNADEVMQAAWPAIIVQPGQSFAHDERYEVVAP